jgi:hypothetical protein
MPQGHGQELERLDGSLPGRSSRNQQCQGALMFASSYNNSGRGSCGALMSLVVLFAVC